MIPDLLGILVLAAVVALTFLRRRQPATPEQPARAPLQPSGEGAEPYAYDGALKLGASPEES